MKEMVFHRLHQKPFVWLITCYKLCRIHEKMHDMLFPYLGIISCWLFCLCNNMLTNIIHLFHAFCFCMRLINVNSASSIRTKGSDILGQWIPCDTLNIMKMGIQNLMDRTWRKETFTKRILINKEFNWHFLYYFFNLNIRQLTYSLSYLCSHPI